MSDRELTVLLDRVAAHTPPMDVDLDSVVGSGRGRVRRRRATGAGMALGALVLAATVWVGPGDGLGPVTGPDLQPAGPVWEQGEPVAGTLFEGLHTIDEAQVAHVYGARLSRPVADGPVVLEVSDGGQLVESVPAQSPVRGLEVFAGERMTVAVWVEPDDAVASLPLVGPRDPGGPSDVQYADVGGRRLAYSAWAGDVVPLPEQVLDVYVVGRDEVAAMSGSPVDEVVLRAGDRRVLAWSDPARDVWGAHGVTRDDSLLFRLSGAPALVAGWAAGEEATVTGLVLLPQGAADVGVSSDPRAVDTDAETLGGRGVVLTVVGPGATVDSTDELVEFELGGVRHDYRSYSEDLTSLETSAGLVSVVTADDRSGDIVLSADDGAEVARLAWDSLQEGLGTSQVGATTVVLAAGWDPGATVLADARVLLTDGARETWTEPRDVAQVVLDDGTLLTAVSVDTADPESVVGVGRQVGEDVEPWDRPSLVTSGVELRDVDGERVPFVGGSPLPRVDDGSLGNARHYSARGARTGYVVVAGAADRAVVPLVLDGSGGLRADPSVVSRVDRVEGDGGVEALLHVDGDLVADGVSRIVGLAAAGDRADGAANSWAVLGSSGSTHVAFDPSALATVSSDLGLWLLYPLGSVDPARLEVGLVGSSLLRLPGGDQQSPTLAAVLPDGTTPVLLDGAGTSIAPTAVHDLGEGAALQLMTWTVRVPDDVSFAEGRAGLDTDADGVVDITLATDPVP